MAIETNCQTPEADYNISIIDNTIGVRVGLPFILNITEDEAKELEANIHNVLELVLSKYFKK